MSLISSIFSPSHEVLIQGVSDAIDKVIFYSYKLVSIPNGGSMAFSR
jgi:hypothetical protein